MWVPESETRPMTVNSEPRINKIANTLCFVTVDYLSTVLLSSCNDMFCTYTRVVLGYNDSN